jgi:hypothetical protein
MMRASGFCAGMGQEAGLAPGRRMVILIVFAFLLEWLWPK